jgi:hypothetical protein
MSLFALVVLSALAFTAVCVSVAVDAASLPEWAFDAAGTNKLLWIVLPVFGIFMCFVRIIVAVLWFGTFKPRVIRATRMGPRSG